MTIAEIENNIARVWTLAEYLAWINRDGPSLTADLAHWAEYGITTAAQLADYLDGCVAREFEEEDYA